MTHERDVYAVYAESRGLPTSGFAEFKRQKGTAFRAWLKKESESQGRGMRRDIGDDVYNACANMFLDLPAPGNTYLTLWKLAFRRAREAGFRDSLDVDALRPEDLVTLANIIDDVFTEGSLRSYIERKHGTVNFDIWDRKDPREPDAAMFQEASTNEIVLVRPTWRRPMPGKTVSMDGARVGNKLEWLMRMLAHELCHCLANMACSESCAKRARNHGPVFQRLNHSIFGHPGSSRRRNRRK